MITKGIREPEYPSVHLYIPSSTQWSFGSRAVSGPAESMREEFLWRPAASTTLESLCETFPSSVPLQTQWSRLCWAQNTVGHTEQRERLSTQHPQMCLMNNIQLWSKNNRCSSTIPNINQQFSKTLLSKIVLIFLPSCLPSDSQPLYILQNQT